MKSLIKSFVITLSLFLISIGHAQYWKHKKVTGNGNLTTETITTPAYDHIKSVGFMDVKLIRGKEGEISVHTDETLHEWIEIKVKKNTLVLDITDNISVRTKKGIHITVPFEDISGVSLIGSGDIHTEDTIEATAFATELIGSGDIDLAIQTSTVKAKVTGSGDLTLSGSTNELHAHVTGSGDFDGGNLESNQTEVSCTGSGDAVVIANSSLYAKVYGSGDVNTKGHQAKKMCAYLDQGMSTNTLVACNSSQLISQL